MSKIFKPADFNLEANPALKKTNSPLRLFLALLLVACALVAFWLFFPPRVHFDQPIVDYHGDHVIAISHARNDTASPVKLSLRFTIGGKSGDSEAGSGLFYTLDQREVSVLMPPHSTQDVWCQFPITKRVMPIYATVELINSR